MFFLRFLGSNGDGGGAGRSMALTVKRVERLSRQGRYSDGHGLYLQVDGGSKRWVFRYSRGGVERYM